jgi:hypothetical protein
LPSTFLPSGGQEGGYGIWLFDRLLQPPPPIFQKINKCRRFRCFLRLPARLPRRFF